MAETVKEVLLKSKEFSEKVDPISNEKVDIFVNFIKNLEHINKTVNELEETNGRSSLLLTDLILKEADTQDFLEKLKTSQEETNILIETNKNLSSTLTSEGMSRTFSEASNYYNKTKNKKLNGIIGVLFMLISYSLFAILNLDLDKLSTLGDKPLVLVVYLLPKIFLITIMSAVLKFLITEYRKDSETALDFKHREAISNVTPGFRQQVDNMENKEKIVMDAFNVLLITKKENHKENKEDKIFLEKFINLLSTEERKDIFSLIKQAFISKLVGNKKPIEKTTIKI